MSVARGVFVVAAKRTAFGAYGGKVKDMTSTDLQEVASRAAMEAGGVSAELIDSVCVGNVIQSSADAAYLARHVALRIGCKLDTPSLTINRLCGSGFQSIVNGAQEIMLGDSAVVMTGGTENMSQAPFAVRNARFGVRLGTDLKMEDTLWAGLTDLHIKTPMGVTAENLAVKYDVSREDCDKFALQTQQRWAAAQAAGAFKDEIAPIEIKTKKGSTSFEIDEHARPDATIESMTKLPPVFKKGGTVTAANASGVCDGASAVILASEEAVAKHNLKPLARLVGYGISGCDPSIMGIGPVPAVEKLLKVTDVSLGQVDVAEVNEAFAAQFLAVQKALGLDPAKTNVNGGAIALGHPLGASGSRIVANLTHHLQRNNLKYGLGGACIGGGQGIAVLLEKC